MKCRNCNRFYPDNFSVCPYCGRKKERHREIRIIKENLEYLKKIGHYLNQSIENIEQSVKVIEKSIPETRKPEKSPPLIKKSKKKNSDSVFEHFMGEKLLLSAGILAILFAVAIFLKFSFERNLFSPAIKVIITIFTGFAFLLTGFLLKKKYRVFGILLSSGGMAVLFFGNFAGAVLYKLYPVLTLFIINIVLLLLSLYLSSLLNTQWASIIGIGGAYLSPITAGETIANNNAFFAYFFVLSLAPIFIAYKKRWQATPVIASILNLL